ncbi:MAG: low molecular weight protein-tyrosine phosphatase [Gemmatimonadaceae bacterium]|nr:low molecular weight protein-tyrosine phosphatase [Gemmatimonadaceae bacterium]
MKAARAIPEPASSEIRRALLPLRAIKLGYHATRHLFERALHPRRHLTTYRRLSNAPRPRRILVICHGNICRSPYLQAVLQRSLPDITVASAGFVGSGRPIPALPVALSGERGFDLSQYRSQPVTQSKVREADLLIVMDSEQARRVARMFRVHQDRIVIAGDLEPIFERTRAIRDPWNQSVEIFNSSFDRLDRCAAALVKVLPNRDRKVLVSDR